jgi:hypothetical protein
VGSFRDCTDPKYHLAVQFKGNEFGGHVARMGEERNVYTLLVGKAEGKRPLRRSKCRWEDGMEMDLWEIGRGVWNGFIWLRIGMVVVLL